MREDSSTLATGNSQKLGADVVVDPANFEVITQKNSLSRLLFSQIPNCKGRKGIRSEEMITIF